MTTIKAWYYSPEDHAKFTPPQEAETFSAYACCKSRKEPLQRPVIAQPLWAELTTPVSAVSAAASAISELTAVTTKCTAAECGEANGSDAVGEPNYGHNCNNPAVAGRQEHVPKKSRT